MYVFDPQAERSIVGQGLLEGLDALGADILPVEYDHVLGVVTEVGGGLLLLEHNGGSVHIDFQRVLLRNVQGAAQFNGEYNTA